MARINWRNSGSGLGWALLHKTDRKSTRLNSSHLGISYAVFCLKKKKRRFARNHALREARSNAVDRVAAAAPERSHRVHRRRENPEPRNHRMSSPELRRTCGVWV